MIVPQNVINTMQNIAIDGSSRDGGAERRTRVAAIIPTRHCNCRAISSLSPPLVQPVCNPTINRQVCRLECGGSLGVTEGGLKNPTTLDGERLRTNSETWVFRFRSSWFHAENHVEDEHNFLPFFSLSFVIFFSASLFFFFRPVISASRRRDVVALRDLRVYSELFQRFF